MPLYEFTCKECKQPFEKLVRRTSLVPTVLCPNCGSHDVQKELSIFATKAPSSSGGPDYSASACAPGGT